MKTLQLFLLAADRLVRCRWDGRSERLEVLNSALEGETLREVARDAADPRRLCAATLTEIHVSEDGGQSWRRLNGNLPAGHAHMTCGFAAHPEDANTLCVGYTDGSIMQAMTPARAGNNSKCRLRSSTESAYCLCRSPVVPVVPGAVPGA